MNDELTADYWLGWVSSTAASAARDLHRGHVSKEDVAADLVRAIDAAIEARPDDFVLRQIAATLPAGFSVVARNGECYAIRDSYDDARRALTSAQDYLDGAATCGHSAAGPWVAQRLPFTVNAISRAERAELLEDGTPVLDREP